MVLTENDGPTIDTGERETTLPSLQSPEHQSTNIASVSYNHNLAMQETQAYPGEGSMQYAFAPDGTLITGPILMSDPHTGHIICSNCWTLKVEASFRTSGPYSFLNPMCLDCERVSARSRVVWQTD